jgi:hypothetical protein
VVAFLRAETNKFHGAYPGARQHIQKHFWEIEVGAIDQTKLLNCATVASSRGMHQVCSLTNKDPTLIQFRQLSYSYLASTSRTPAFECEQTEHVPPWRLHRLQPQNTREVREMMYDSEEEFHSESRFEQICEDVQVGENVAVPTDLAHEPFWIVLCDRAIHIVQESFTDAWDNSFVVGDVVIRGYYYECMQEGSRSYFLSTNKPQAYLFAHLVLASKFSMPPTQHVVKGSHVIYELRHDVLCLISDALI